MEHPERASIIANETEKKLKVFVFNFSFFLVVDLKALDIVGG